MEDIYGQKSVHNRDEIVVVFGNESAILYRSSFLVFSLIENVAFYMFPNIA